MDMLSLQELDDLIDRLESGPPPRAEIERVLTDGYAEALELEADCLLFMRRLAEAADQDVASLSRQLESCSARLAALRARLDRASRRLGRNPLSDQIR